MTCQVGQDSLFAVDLKALDCQMVFANSNGKTFRTEKLPKARIQRKTPCILNIDDKQIFIIGGQNNTTNLMQSSISQFNIAQNCWIEKNPKLVIARVASSGCRAGETIYVVGGVDCFGKTLNSIETLSIPDLAKGKAAWKLIETPEAEFPGRGSPVVAALNSEEIVILGGWTGRERINLSDICRYNFKTGKFFRECGRYSWDELGKPESRFFSPMNHHASY